MTDPRTDAWGDAEADTFYSTLAATPHEPIADFDAAAHPLSTRVLVEKMCARLLGQSTEVCIGRYAIEERLGAGAMGEVYAARERETGERVALKLMSRVNATRLVRFKREFRSLAKIDHPNVVRLGELVVPEAGAPYFTMELVDGQDFVHWVRAGRRVGELPDLERLRAALRQLLAGLVQLHEAGLVHRDLKPSNILVSATGRVVILDFGLIVERHEHAGALTLEGQVVGTPAYMAPEQGMGRSTDPSVDAYAVGVIVFECLTGELPVAGSAMSMILAKQQGPTPDPGGRAEQLPEPLRDLSMGLLAIDPRDRLGAAQALAALGGPLERVRPVALGSSRTRSLLREPDRGPFVGRTRELDLLDASWTRVERERATITVHIHGPSGHGKSTLLDSFCERVRARSRCVILRGRCLERESVPFKGIDAFIDALLVWLRGLDEATRARYEPRHLDALVRVFPVLDTVWTAPRRVLGQLEAPVMRRLALASLRELLGKIAERERLIVAIDDFQWSDADSTRLLGALVREPDPPPLLLLVAFRDELVERASLAELLAPRELAGRDVRDLALGPLDDRSAQALAKALFARHLDEPDPSEAIVEDCVARAGGSPFFLTQLVLNQDISTTSGADSLLARRIAALSEPLRAVLQIVALAGGPLELALVGELAQAQLGPEHEIHACVAALRELGLLAPAQGVGDTLETSHDRIREVAAASLAPEAARALHLALAELLDRHDKDPHTIAEHFEHAGEPGRALHHVEQAANQAIAALAFARAAALLRRALRLVEGEQSIDLAGKRQQLRAALAEQLVNLGHRGEAGELLCSLAETADDERAVELRCEAAEQFLHAGRVDEGMALTSSVLQALAEPTPRGTVITILRILWERLRLRLRGFDYVTREAGELPERVLARVDLLTRLQIGLTIQSVGHSVVMSVRLLRQCLDLGEPRRVGTMLMFEMTTMSALDRITRARELQRSVRALAEATGDDDLHRLLDFGICMCRFSEGRYREAHTRYAELVARLREQPTKPWVQALASQLHALLSVDLGDWRAIARELPARIIEARERGNPYEIISLEGDAARLAALLGDHEAARGHIERARAILTPRLYTSVNLFLEHAEVQVTLARGDAEAALRQLDGVPVRARAGGLIMMAPHWRSWRTIRGRCLAQLVLRAPADRGLQRRLRALIRKQRRSSYRDEHGCALVNLATLHTLRADEHAARGCWREAEAMFAELGFEAHVAVLRWRLAETATEPAGSRIHDRSTYFRAQGIDDPERIVALLAPAHSLSR